MISPLDDRYRGKTSELDLFFSEAAFTMKRIQVEVLWLSYLQSLGCFTGLPEKIDVPETAFKRVKEIESETKHDVKAIEYYLREVLPGFENWIHFGLTSEDVNGVAIAVLFLEFFNYFFKVQREMSNVYYEFVYPSLKDTTILGFTHGQPALPLSFDDALRFPYPIVDFGRYFHVKFGGAVGNCLELRTALPKIFGDQIDFDKDLLVYEVKINNFLRNFFFNLKDDSCYYGSVYLSREHVSAQRGTYTDLLKGMYFLKDYASKLLDFCQNVWLYCLKEYLYVSKEKGQIGSSVMPHKSNPIYFESAEGNLELAISTLQTLMQTLPLSRLQRDLSDSTQLRNIGVACGHLILAMKHVTSGLKTLNVNTEKIIQDSDAHPEVALTLIQTIMRREGIKDAYERTKNFFDSCEDIMSKYAIEEFIDSLDVSEEAKIEMKESMNVNF